MYNLLVLIYHVPSYLASRSSVVLHVGVLQIHEALGAVMSI
jgi:hypothetical protein